MNCLIESEYEKLPRQDYTTDSYQSKLYTPYVTYPGSLNVIFLRLGVFFSPEGGHFDARKPNSFIFPPPLLIDI